MRLGLSVYDTTFADLRDLAVAADELGFSSLWLGEHVVLPLGYGSEHPSTEGETEQHHTGPIIDPSTRLLDPLVALAGVAAVTSRITLATGIYLLPLRPPLVTARMAATAAEVSGGRFVLGVGAGWLEEEFEAVGVPFAERTARYLESIEVLRAAWSGEPFSHAGRHWATGSVQLTTEPVAVPLVLGGNGPRALRRAAELGDGWFSSGTPTFEEALALRRQLLALRREAGRADRFDVHVRARIADADELDRYAEAGFEDVVIWADTVWPDRGDIDHKRAQLREAAARLGLAPPTEDRPEENP